MNENRRSLSGRGRPLNCVVSVCAGLLLSVSAAFAEGDAQFAKEREYARANDYSAVGLMMEKYRDNVRVAFDALKKQHPDAEKHSSGYRQLEIHVGVGIREVRDVILAAPEPYRPPMQLVEDDLKAMDRELLQLLFPRRPGEKPAAQQGAAAPKEPGNAKPPEPEKKP